MNLILFFTRGISLKIWHESGLLDREKKIYEHHLKDQNLKKVYWITYGLDDLKLSEKLKRKKKLHKNIIILPIPKFLKIFKFSYILYSLFVPFYYSKIIKKSDILKTNQIDGSWSALISKWFFKKKLLLRSGYILSQLENSKNQKGLRYGLFKLIEKIIFSNSDLITVTSKHNKLYLLKNYSLSKTKIVVLRNFVDISRFKPMRLKRFENKIIYIGRLNREKNLFNLIQAISKTEFTLDIYGQGNLFIDLKNYAYRIGANVNFKGSISNDKLARIYNQYRYFILPSYFEGMPKTLIEAMACGCFCIGTNVKGINEVIKDNINGYLSKGLTQRSLLKVLQKVKKNKNKKITANAVNTIKKNFSLNVIGKIEKKIFDNFKNEKK